MISRSETFILLGLILYVALIWGLSVYYGYRINQRYTA